MRIAFGGLVGAGAAAGPVARVLDDGPAQATQGHRLAALLVLWALALSVRPQRWVVSAAIVALPLIAVAAATSSLGRTPAFVGHVLVALAVAGAADLPDVWGRSRGRPAPSVVLAGAAMADGVVWYATGSLTATMALAFGCALLLAARTFGPGLLEPIDRPLRDSGRELARRAAVAAERARRRGGEAWVSRHRLLPGPSRSRLALFGVVTGAMVPMFHRIVAERAPVFGYNDLDAHLDAARTLSLSPFRVPPYPAFHLAVRLGTTLVGVTWAATVVLSASVGLFAVGAHRLALRPGRGAAGTDPTPPDLGRGARGIALGFAVFAVVGESPTALLVAAHAVQQAASIAVVHTWANPTDTVAFGVTLLLLPLLVDLIDSHTDAEVAAPRPAAVAGLTVLSMLAKPSFVIALDPALIGYVVLWRRADLGLWRDLARQVMVPSLVVLVTQGVILTSLMPPQLGNSGIAIAPFRAVEQQHIGRGGIYFWATLGVPLLAAAAGRRRYLADTAVRLSLVGLAFAAALMLLVVETGPRAIDGNFGRPAFFWWVITYLTSARFLLAETLTLPARWRAGRRRPPLWAFFAAVYVGMALGAGVAVYLDAAGAGSILNWA